MRDAAARELPAVAVIAAVSKVLARLCALSRSDVQLQYHHVDVQSHLIDKFVLISCLSFIHPPFDVARRTE